MDSWAVGFVVVHFDIELGPVIESTYPIELILSEFQQNHIKFMAFPDSSQMVGDMMFSFRFPVTENTKRCVYGYSIFRQQRDVNEARGYFQKALVLLSMKPFSGLFEKVMSIVGPLYFQHGVPLLECAWNGIKLWKEPSLGSIMELPLMGHILQIYLPKSAPSSTDTKVEAVLPREQPLDILPSPTVVECSEYHQDAHIFINFHEILDSLPCLWEIVLTGQPLLIATSSPTKAAQSVLALTSLIAPCPYGCDYRPYYTIHDPTFKEYSSRSHIPSALLGTTNPFFLQAMGHWPHILLLSFNQNGSNRPRKLAPSKSGSSLGRAMGTHASSPALSAPSTAAFKTELRTASTFHHPFEKALLRQLLESDLHRRTVKCDALLRRYFRLLTEKFLTPLEQYFQSLMPLAKTLTPYTRIPDMHPFSPADFIHALESERYVLALPGPRAKWMPTYRSFVQSANFRAWYVMKRKYATAHLFQLYLNKLPRPIEVSAGDDLVHMRSVFMTPDS